MIHRNSCLISYGSCYSLFAWDTGAVGYILKPYKAQSVYDAIEKFKKLKGEAQEEAAETEIPFVGCFPDFELIVDGEPVFFKNKKSKELLCDYYQYLAGKTDLFIGDYMGEYTWAESTRGFLFR